MRFPFSVNFFSRPCGLLPSVSEFGSKEIDLEIVVKMSHLLASTSRARVEIETRVVWSVKKIDPTLSRVSLTSACLRDEKQKTRLYNSKNTPVLDVRCKIVIVISVKNKLVNFKEHDSGWPC